MTHSLHRLPRLGLFLSALLLSACVTTLGTPAWLPNTFTDDQPVLAQLKPGKHRPSLSAQGLEVDVRQEQSAALGLLSLPALEAMLNQELQKIKDAIGFPQLPGKVYIMASPTMNAMAKADGNIYIPIGMIMDIDSTDEMMALLGHELAHVLLNHTDTDLLASIQRKGANGWALIQQYSNETGDMALTRRARNTLTFSMAVDRLLHPTWNRQQEFAADKLGIDILVATRRDPNAMIVLLRRLDDWEEINQRLVQENKERSSWLANAASDKYAPAEWQSLIKQALTPATVAIEDKVDDLAETHASTDDRLEAATEYLRQHHRRTPRPPAETRRWQTIAHSAEAKRQAAAVKQAYNAYTDLLVGNRGAAQNGFKRIPPRDGNNQNYYRMLQAMLAEYRDKPAEVARIAFAARSLPYPSYRFWVLEGRARHASTPPSVDSVQALYDTFDTYGRPTDYYVDILQLARQTGNEPFRYNILVRCYADNLGVRGACDDTVKQASAEQGGGSLLEDMMKVFGRLK